MNPEVSPTPTPEAPVREPLRRAEMAALLGLTLLAALVRLPLLSRFGLWLDEIYVREAALEPLAANLRTVHFIHFLAVKAGLAIADSDFGLRLASATLGIAAVPLGYLAVRRALGLPVAIYFATFLASIPYFVNFSIDANYYSHMILWSLLGLGTTLRMMERGHPPGLALLVPLALAAFFVHPFSAIFFAALFAVGATDSVLAWRGRNPTRTGGLGPKDAALALLAILSVAGLLRLFASTAAGGELIRVAGRFADMIEVGRSPTNVEFSWAFFENFFRRIGPAYYDLGGAAVASRLVAPVGSLFCFCAFLAGLWRLRGRPRLAAVIVLPFLLSFAVLFNLKAERHFNLRYFSYLAPLYWLGIALGAQGLAAALARRLPIGMARSLPLLLAAILIAPQYGHLLLSDGRNWDAVVPAIAARIRPGEPLVYTNWAEEAMLPFYQRRYRLESQPIRRLAHTPRRDELSAAELRDLCYRSPSLWFVSSWLDIQSDKAVAWAATHMETVAAGASIFSDRYDVTAYHWDRGGRYILPPRILDYRPRPADLSNGSFFQSFTFEESLAYRIEVASHTAAVGPLTLEVEDRSLPMTRLENAPPGETRWSAVLPIAKGDRRLSLSGFPHGGIKLLRIAPVYAESTILIAATGPSVFYPSDFVWSAEIDGRNWLGLKRNTFATYDFSVLESGAYELGCVARHDRPGPVWIEIRIDDIAAGVLEFAADDNASDVRHLPVQLTAGDHRLTARFLNEGAVQELPEDLDRDAWIQSFSLRPLDAASTARDERLFSPRGAAASVPLATSDATGPGGSWSLTADGDLQARIVPADLPGGVAWTADLPRGSEGLLLRSAHLPLAAPGWVYLSAQLRAENLLNHSINLRVSYLDADGNSLGEKIVNQEGVYRTTDWVRLVEFQPVPGIVRSVRLAFWAYPNGRQPSPEPGRVFFGDVRIESGAPGVPLRDAGPMANPNR